jgi:hypothetical protein
MASAKPLSSFMRDLRRTLNESSPAELRSARRNPTSFLRDRGIRVPQRVTIEFLDVKQRGQMATFCRSDGSVLMEHICPPQYMYCSSVVKVCETKRRIICVPKQTSGTMTAVGRQPRRPHLVLEPVNLYDCSAVEYETNCMIFCEDPRTAKPMPWPLLLTGTGSRRR